MPAWEMAVVCRKWTSELTFSCLQKAKQLSLLLVNMAFGKFFRFSWCLTGRISIWIFLPADSTSHAIWNLKISLSCVCFLCLFLFWKNLPSFWEKDGTAFSFNCMGGISSNQNAIISENERPLYRGFTYSMNFRGNYNHYFLKIL